MPSDAQAGWKREQSAKTMRAVSASPVVASALANVFVRLSKPIVILVFCDMLKYLHPCSTKALPCELIVSNCLTPDVARQVSSSPVACSESFQFSLDTSCSFGMLSAHVFVPKTDCSSVLTFSASAVVLVRAFCLVCCRALALLSANSFAVCLNCGFSAVRFYGVLHCNRPGFFSGLELLNCLLYLPVVSVLLLLKRFLDSLNLVFQLGRFQFLCVFPRHLL